MAKNASISLLRAARGLCLRTNCCRVFVVSFPCWWLSPSGGDAGGGCCESRSLPEEMAAARLAKARRAALRVDMCMAKAANKWPSSAGGNRASVELSSYCRKGRPMVAIAFITADFEGWNARAASSIRG
eukprot:Gregarina_sp_Poly_1__10261@NODE_718_length_6629_cov_150_601798_g540_i0_p6_GENE_NODE_718_length_6629_cov_150_601798_g540_i0NODE_718_length_6629_cov_150_601798_g540_i0_p6_ORF_typecomplete_len129_score9_82DUF3619/PF12279_8/0_041_NODE_718_length_6629_cov_150_601798_g540_i0318704